jgi:DNA segregation ATPase FtsK/SpoIIIE, S-DNA-T family
MMRRQLMQPYSRPENALAYAVLAAFCAGSLPEGTRLLGAVGQWASHGLHTAFGVVSWLVPAWLADAARRAHMGEPQRRLRWAFYGVVACTTAALCGVAGGWVGTKIGSALQELIGVGSYLIVVGVWIVAGLRVLGPHRVHELVGHASMLSRRALEQYRPVRMLPTADQLLQAEIVEAYPEAATRPVGIPAPATALEPIEVPQPPPSAAPTAAPPKPRMPSKWTLPRASLLRATEVHRVDQSYLSAVAHNLGIRLASYKIGATVAPAAVQGKLVSKFELAPSVSQQIGPIKAKQVDLEAAYEGLRFVDMPGTGKLGIEIPLPKAQRKPIGVREVIDSAAWIDTDAALPLALGVTTAGEPVVVDLATCPHLLVAGATGAGKSVGLNVMLCSLLLNNSPAELQLLLIDAKLVEFARYRGLPHLHCPPVTEVQEAIEKLQWAVEEMERRYLRFVDADVNDIDSFNSESGQRLPRIVVVIDEYADLTSVKGREVEGAVCRLAQKARGAGIHLIVATQRPSVDVITGVIKANFPSRIAYKVSQSEDSKTILGQTGAQLLIGDGDSLCLLPKLSINVTRVHGAYISSQEIRDVNNAWKAQTDPSQPEPVATVPTLDKAVEVPPEDTCASSESVAEALRPSAAELASKQSPADDIYERAVAYARQKQAVSARQLGVELRCGFERAKKLFERMKDEGLVRPGGPNNTHIFIGSN